MEQKYKRIEHLDQKIKNISLPYLEWKALFLVADGTSVADIAEYVPEDEKVLEDILNSLLEKELVQVVSEEEMPVPEEEEKPVESKIEEIDLVEEEIEEAPIEDETKIEVTELPEEKPDEEEETDEEEIDVEEPEPEEEHDDLTEIPDLVEEGEPEESEAVAAELEPAETITEEVEKEDTVAEEEIMPSVEPEPAAEPEEEPGEPEKEEIISDVSKKSIMVIDDSIVIRKMIEIALEEEDLQIFTATSGKEGMELIEKQSPHLVILDMMLPDMNGIDLLKQIKEAKKIPVIMLSGKDSPQLVENAKESGVDDFLPKPFKDEELVDKVKALIG